MAGSRYSRWGPRKDKLGLQPFFSYFGSKWRLAKTYAPPVHDTIVEPFAGGAGYALRFFQRNVVLVEKNPRLAAVWRWLIQATPELVWSIPLVGDVGELSSDTPEPVRDLVGWNLGQSLYEPRRRMSPYARRCAYDVAGVAWSDVHRARIARQVGFIRHWKVIEGDYTQAPDVEAAWFIDPPYQVAGKSYTYGSKQLDFPKLGEWCRTRRGQVMVCENQGADWLPFRYHRGINGNRNTKSVEVIWTNAVGGDTPAPAVDSPHAEEEA